MTKKDEQPTEEVPEEPPPPEDPRQRVVMTHVASETDNATTTMEAFRQVWEPAGWSLVPDADPNNPNPTN